MNKYEKGFKRYRRFIERMSGRETVYAGLSYYAFCACVDMGKPPYVNYVIMGEKDSMFIDNYIRKHKIIQ